MRASCFTRLECLSLNGKCEALGVDMSSAKVRGRIQLRRDPCTDLIREELMNEDDGSDETD